MCTQRIVATHRFKSRSSFSRGYVETSFNIHPGKQKRVLTYPPVCWKGGGVRLNHYTGRVSILTRRVSILPGRVNILPGRVSFLTRRVNILPGRVNILARRVGILPGRINILSRRVSISPRRVSILPGRVSILPGRVSIPAGRIMKIGDKIKRTKSPMRFRTNATFHTCGKTWYAELIWGCKKKEVNDINRWTG